jgi:preprotein translocase subunit YajC
VYQPVKDLAGLLPFILIALVFYFLLLRPQRRRAQTLSATQSSLQPGAEVMLTSGIFGRVASLDDETIQLELSSGIVVKVLRQAVARVVEPATPGPFETEDDLDGELDHPGDDPGPVR